ncbi:MAG: hypothetical protein RL693_1081 [Verrucomicrobiota bacterium]|jgi:hypothetical protein
MNKHDSLYSIVDRTLIPHHSFEKAVTKIGQCYRAAMLSSVPPCIALIGESRTGKSTVLDHFLSLHQRSRTADGLKIPVLLTTVPSMPRIKGLASVILHGLEDPVFYKGSEAEMQARILKLLKATGTKVLVLDEFQHFRDKTTYKIQHAVTDWLKVLVDEAKIGLVVSGLPYCLDVIEQNEQLRGRFVSPLELPRFDWINSYDQSAFAGVLEGFRQAMADFEMPAISEGDMPFRFYCASGGLIGYVTKILRQATWNAIDKNSRSIKLSDLATAYSEAVLIDQVSIDELGAYVNPVSPFSPSFSGAPEQLITSAGKVGRSKNTESLTASRKKRAPASKQTSKQNVFSGGDHAFI